MGTRDLMGNTFQKAIVLSMLMKNQQLIKILCKLQRILQAEEQHQVLLQTLFYLSQDMWQWVSRATSSSTATPDGNSPTPGSPPSHLDCIFHSSTRTSETLPDHLSKHPGTNEATISSRTKK